MSPMLMWPMIIEGLLLTALVVLLIYRSTLTMHEDEQLFLDESASAMAQEQQEVISKLNKLSPMLKWVGAASGVLGLVIVSVAVYQQLQLVQ
jgi:Tfp pilus assembly protein PilN